MGVIHKLTDEVVQFIVTVKKEQPGISCRKLADTVSERFQLHVSKSSVNAILKNNDLSGAVGRPPGIHSKKTKFTIPVERKKQLLGELETYKDLPPPMEAPKDLPPKERVEVPPPGPVLTEKEVPRLSEEPTLQLMPDPLEQDTSPEAEPMETVAGTPKEDLEQEFSLMKQRFEMGKSEVFAQAGIALVKAAQSELSLISVFARLLEQHTDVGPAKETRRLCEAICYLRLLGIGDPQDIDSPKTTVVWALLGENLTVEVAQFWQKILALKMPKSFVIIFLTELQQFGAQIRSFRIFLEDTSDFLLDVDLCSFGEWCGPKLRPMDKALAVLSTELISNNKPVIIAQVPVNEQEEAFRNFVKSFGAIPSKGIVKIQALNEKNQKLAEFGNIPRIRRTFMAGLSPDHRVFADLTRSIKWAGTRPFYSPELDQLVHFSYINADFVARQWDTAQYLSKVIAVWPDRGSEPVGAIVTNDPNAEPDKILQDYLIRWPDIFTRPAMATKGASLTGEIDNTSRNLIIAEPMDCLDEINRRSLLYLGRQYLLDQDVTRLRTKYYGLSGCLVNQKAFQKVIFESRIEPLDLLVMLNQANIVDAHGRRLCFA